MARAHPIAVEDEGLQVCRRCLHGDHASPPCALPAWDVQTPAVRPFLSQVIEITAVVLTMAGDGQPTAEHLLTDVCY